MNSVFQNGSSDLGGAQCSARMLSDVGAALFSAVVTLLCALSAVCLRTDVEGAVYSLFAVAFMLISVYLISALLTHGRLLIVCLSAIVAFIAGFVLTADLLRAALPLTFYVAPMLAYFIVKKHRLTYTGGVVVGAVAIGTSLVCILCALVYSKYGEVSLSSVVRAYESFCELILSSPRASLSMLEAEAVEGMESFVESYRALVLTLEQMLDVMLYSLPSIFMSVCAIGGFVCIFSQKRHRRMQALEDSIGPFEMSVVSAVLYIVLNLLILFVDPITPLGIAVITVCSPIELGLALLGGVWGYFWIKKNDKSQMYYVIPVLLAVMIPSACISLLAYLGAYRTVFLYRLRRLQEKNADDGDQRR